MEDDTEKPTHPKIRMSGYKIIVHYLFLSILAPLSSKPERERKRGSALLCVQCYATESIHCKSLTCCLEVSFHIHLAIANKSLT